MTKVALVDGGPTWFDIDKAEEFAGKAQGQGTMYRTAEGHFVLYDQSRHTSQNDNAAFIWLINNDHQAAAEKYLPVVWSQRQI